MRVAAWTTWLLVKMKPSGVITNPEPFPAMSRGWFLVRCWTSMFTTEGATRSTALTTAREYSSKSAGSDALAAVSLHEARSEFASPNKNSGRAARSKFVVVIHENSSLPIHSSTTGQSNLYIPFGMLHAAGAWIKRRHG